MEEENEFELSFVFSENIERIWFWARDAQLLLLINSFDVSPITMIKGKDTFTIGNEFTCTISQSIEMKGKVIEVQSLAFQKSIQWEYIIINKFKLLFSLNLYKITESSNTVVLFNTKINDSNEIKSLLKYSNLKETLEAKSIIIIDNMKKVLADSSINLSLFESGMIRTTMDSLWDLLSDLKKLKIVAPLCCLDFEYHYDKMEIGTILKVTSIKNKSCLLKITKIDKRPESNKWMLSYEIIDGDLEMPFQETTVCIKKSNQECHFSILTEFRTPVTNERVKKYSEEKRYLIASIKNFLENY